jgi:hypothetical protein
MAGSPPQLDALLEYSVSVAKHGGTGTRWTVDKQRPVYPPGDIPIPVAREVIGGWPVACCSSPIAEEAAATTVEHITKRMAVEHADLLAPEHRKTVITVGFWTKSYRLPLDVRRVERVVWFCLADREAIEVALGRVKAIGQRVAKGYGAVSRWEVEPTDRECWWYADAPEGTLLMRPLPLCDELPNALVGYRKSFGACCPPYWHGDRYCEIVEPI